VNVTSNQAGRVGFKLVGAYLVASGLIVFAGGLNSDSFVMTSPQEGVLSSFFVSLVAGFLTAAFCCVLPGLYLLARGDSVADRFFPQKDDAVSLTMDSKALFSVLVASLGVLFLVRGAAGVFASGTFFASASALDNAMAKANGLQGVVSSLVTFACGWFLLRSSGHGTHAA
jgi:hypothetical protein